MEHFFALASYTARSDDCAYESEPEFEDEDEEEHLRLWDLLFTLKESLSLRHLQARMDSENGNPRRAQ
jgi:hypothetical protein